MGRRFLDVMMIIMTSVLKKLRCLNRPRVGWGSARPGARTGAFALDTYPRVDPANAYREKRHT